MPRNTADATRRKILEAAYKLFYRKGFVRVGVDEIADQSGITKRTLYYHFASKDDLLSAVLAHQHELAMARIVHDGKNHTGSAGSVLAKRFDDLSAWMATRGWTGSGFTRLAMELADLPGHPARKMARRHKLEVENWLGAELAKSGGGKPHERAREISILMEGAMAMVLITGDRTYAETARQIARRLEHSVSGSV
jgi:AcrR family transcriptional regulator